MQSLREAAHVVERSLSDVAYLVEFGTKRRALRNLFFRAAQHGADGGENLAKLIVQFARDITQRGLLRGDELLRELAPQARERSKLGEEAAIRADQVQAGEENRHKRSREEAIDLTLHAVIDLRNLKRRLFFTFVVLHQEASHGCAQDGLAGLQGKANLVARILIFAVAGERKDALSGAPKLRERACKVLFLLRGAAGEGQLLFVAKGVIQSGTNALELRRPGGERIGLVVIEHVAHRKSERVQVILDAQELQRVLAAEIGQIILQIAKSGNLNGDVPGISHHRGKRNHQSEDECGSGRTPWRALHESRIQRATAKFHCRADGD